uniref:EGF-like domain-containing protein n=1 Tax=Panagrolaimus davidi TaxID=227884 RepID=A0A914PEW9_9BILA
MLCNESGDSDKTPLLTFRALLSSSKIDDRDSFINIWESKDTSDFLLFSVGPSTSIIETENKLHDFHVKYSSKAQGECLNNGFMLPNNTCVCPPYFTQSDCSQMTCLNSGIQATNFRCSCPPGYIGRFCEQMGCMAAFDSEFDFKKRSFVIVLNIIRDASFMITTVQSTVNNLLQSRAGHYNNFILSTYYMNSQLSNYFSYTSITTNFTVFQNQLSSVYANKDGQNKKQPTLSAINSALTKQSQITPKSDIYVFTLSPPSDYSTTDPYTESSTSAESILSRTVINWGHSVYTILGQSALSPFNETDPAINAFKNIAAISNGEFIYVASRTSDAARAFQSIFALNLYPETVASQRNFNCSTPVSVSIVNGAYDTGIFIYTSGIGITVTYNGAALTANATYGDFQVFNQGYSDSRATITIGGSTACSYRIFTSSLESVIPGFAATTQVDISKSYPSAYIPVFPVARIVSSSPPNLLHFYAVSQSGDALLADGGEAQNARSDCNFPFQFQSWNCSERAFFSKFTYTESSGTTTRMIPSVCFTPSKNDVIVKVDIINPFQFIVILLISH